MVTIHAKEVNVHPQAVIRISGWRNFSAIRLFVNFHSTLALLFPYRTFPITRYAGLVGSTTGRTSAPQYSGFGTQADLMHCTVPLIGQGLSIQ